MREILFRAKAAHTIDHEWLYGYVCAAPWEPEGMMIICVTEDGNAGGETVIPETVGQFTGLTDKNGKKIFEGDIVSVLHEGIYRCYWDEGNLEFGLANEKESFGIAYASRDIFIIGNIHDDPELLKEDTYEENPDTV